MAEQQRNFIKLNAQVLDNEEYIKDILADVQANKVEYEFPSGFAEIPLIEECRALNALDDFDLMYDITMQMLVGKPVYIYVYDETGRKNCIAKFVVTDRYMNLRGVDCINQYPILVNWLTSFIAGLLRKKFPKPLSAELAPMVSWVEQTNPEIKAQRLKEEKAKKKTRRLLFRKKS